MNNTEQKNKIIDEIALKINHLQNERQKADNEAYLKYMDDCIELLEEYGVFADGDSEEEARKADVFLDYVKLKRKQCEFPVIENREEVYTRQVQEEERQASKEFDELMGGRPKGDLPV